MKRFLEFIAFTATASVLEYLFALNYLWLAVVAALPPGSVQGNLLLYLNTTIGHTYTFLLFLTAAFFSLLSIYKNLLWVRATLMIFNVMLCLFTGFAALLSIYPPSSGAGFVLILGLLAFFATLRMIILGVLGMLKRSTS